MSGSDTISAQARRGSAAVGYLSDLAEVEAASVMALRLWCDGAHNRAALQDEFTAHLGEGRARAALDAWQTLLDMCHEFGRRPLMRHGVSCKCLGADEACFAHFMAAATLGEREDAMMIATLLVRPDCAPMVTALAAECGMALQGMHPRPSASLSSNHTVQTPTLH
ncbi:hypothetical protein O4H61_05275 [Roseovarius aestuarii]|nr:hypothetical protein [Roseovarius aestuarii]